MTKSCVCLNLVTLVCEGAAHLVRFCVTCNDKMHHDHGRANQKPILCVLEKIDCWSINLTLGYWRCGLVQLIEEEDYWKRRASERWRNCDISCHGESWKQLFFERNLDEFLEEYANSFLYFAMRCPRYRRLSCINLNYLRPACTNTTCHCWSFNCWNWTDFEAWEIVSFHP